MEGLGPLGGSRVSKARLVITAVVVEGRRQADVARDYQVSKGWVSKLVARYRAESDAAFQPRTRRPHSWPPADCPTATVELIVAIRDRLVAEGHDAGADTIVWHLTQGPPPHRVPPDGATAS